MFRPLAPIEMFLEKRLRFSAIMSQGSRQYHIREPSQAVLFKQRFRQTGALQ